MCVHSLFMAHSWAQPCPQSNTSTFFHACEGPMFHGLRLDSMALSHVWLCLPDSRFQSDRCLWITAATAWWWSSLGALSPLCAVWPKCLQSCSITMLLKTISLKCGKRPLFENEFKPSGQLWKRKSTKLLCCLSICNHIHWHLKKNNTVKILQLFWFILSIYKWHINVFWITDNAMHC